MSRHELVQFEQKELWSLEWLNNLPMMNTQVSDDDDDDDLPSAFAVVFVTDSLNVLFEDQVFSGIFCREIFSWLKQQLITSYFTYSC